MIIIPLGHYSLLLTNSKNFINFVHSFMVMFWGCIKKLNLETLIQSQTLITKCYETLTIKLLNPTR